MENNDDIRRRIRLIVSVMNSEHCRLTVTIGNMTVNSKYGRSFHYNHFVPARVVEVAREVAWKG